MWNCSCMKLCNPSMLMLNCCDEFYEKCSRTNKLKFEIGFLCNLKNLIIFIRKLITNGRCVFPFLELRGLEFVIILCRMVHTIYRDNDIDSNCNCN
jgi:hypothetical protein